MRGYCEAKARALLDLRGLSVPFVAGVPVERAAGGEGWILHILETHLFFYTYHRGVPGY